MKYILLTILFLFLTIVQVSFLPTWPTPVSSLNIIISVVLFAILMFDFRTSLFTAFSLGLLLELYSVIPFGVVALSLMITAIVIDWLYRHIFTNRSFYAVIGLGVAGTAFFHILVALILGGIALISSLEFSLIFDPFYFKFALWQIVLNTLVLSIMFLVSRFVHPRPRASFIIHR